MAEERQQRYALQASCCMCRVRRRGITEDDLYSDGYCSRWALSSVQHRDCHIQISCEGEPDEVRQEVIACESVDGRESMVCAKDDIDERDKDGECEPVRLVRKKYERPDEVDGELEYIISNGDTDAINGGIVFLMCADNAIRGNAHKEKQHRPDDREYEIGRIESRLLGSAERYHIISRQKRRQRTRGKRKRDTNSKQFRFRFHRMPPLLFVCPETAEFMLNMCDRASGANDRFLPRTALIWYNKR